MSREALFDAVRRGDVVAAREAIEAVQAQGVAEAQAMRLGRWADESGNTLACVAAAAGHAPLIDLFHSVGMDLTVPNGEGNSPIHLAALRCEIAAMRSLRAAGVDLAQENTSHQAAVHIAACHGWVLVMEELRAAGVDLTARNSTQGWSPWTSRPQGDTRLWSLAFTTPGWT